MRRHRPKTVGLSINMMTKRWALEMMRFCREQGAFVIVGGPEPINYPQEYLRFGADVIVAGEGELTLEELLVALKNNEPRNLEKIPGIIFRNPEGAIVSTAPRPLIRDLDKVPWPDREAIDLTPYLKTWKKHHQKSSLSLICGRGCSFTCRWCSHSVFGFTHRQRSPQAVADELQWLLERYQPAMVWYADDVFTLNRPWINRYGQELSKRGLRVPFETITRADCLDEPTADELALMGCQKIWIGSESGSQKILDAMDRRVRVDQVISALHMLKTRGIKTGLFLMLVYLGETKADLRQTLNLLCQGEPTDYLTTVSYPIKGTGYYQEIEPRLKRPASWETTTDRDWIVQKRPPKNYYIHAAQWIHGEYQRHLSQRKKSPGAWKLALRGLTNSWKGRLGMALS